MGSRFIFRIKPGSLALQADSLLTEPLENDVSSFNTLVALGLPWVQWLKTLCSQCRGPGSLVRELDPKAAWYNQKQNKMKNTTKHAGTRDNITRFRLPRRLNGKESTFNAGDTGDVGSILGLGRSPGRGDDNPLEYSCQADNLE